MVPQSSSQRRPRSADGAEGPVMEYDVPLPAR